MKNGCSLNTKVYKTLTDSGLLLHYHSHVAGRYKRSLVNTMLRRVLRLLSTWEFFQEECERLKETFARLCYTQNILVQSTIRPFIESKVSEDSHTQASEKRVPAAPIRNGLPFKDQKWANAVSKQLGDLSRKVNVDISPVHTSRRIRDEIKVREDKLPLVNLRCVMYPP